tara:strand:+ start:190 stop:354 length:165 start_codon:yes stop_codon:yes gene_type:complete
MLQKLHAKNLRGHLVAAALPPDDFDAFLTILKRDGLRAAMIWSKATDDRNRAAR